MEAGGTIWALGLALLWLELGLGLVGLGLGELTLTLTLIPNPHPREAMYREHEEQCEASEEPTRSLTIP